MNVTINLCGGRDRDRVLFLIGLEGGDVMKDCPTQSTITEAKNDDKIQLIEGMGMGNRGKDEGGHNNYHFMCLFYIYFIPPSNG